MIKPGYVKRMFVTSEMIEGRQWPPQVKMKDEIDSILLSLASPEDGGGCAWEFKIALEDLSRKATPKLVMWNDSWEAFEDAKEVFQVLRVFQEVGHREFSDRWHRLIDALEKVGWERVKPVPVTDKWPEPCPTCGKV